MACAFLECQRPPGWCSHRGAVYLKPDCDYDGVRDCLCVDGRGRMWTKLSSKGFREDRPGFARCDAVPFGFSRR